MWTAGRGAREPLREAVTEYVVLKRFSDTEGKTLNQDNKYSYLEVYPKTGRTHQIRVHMRYINHPVVSDPLYRGTKDLALGMERLALHASSIKFRLPASTQGGPNGEEITIESPLPADFKKVINTYLA
jgi:23S rRNA pseudouridine1911/1915/1917 synthase